jgi:glucose-1-phosphatase
MNTHSIEVVLFDLGGVIIQFQKAGYFAQMLGEVDDASAMNKWVECPALQAYEKGEIDRDQFAHGIVKHFDVDSHPNDFLASFLKWPQDIFPGSQEMMTDIRADIRFGCLSNTSEFHWDNQKSSATLKDMFELRFLSFEMGQLKPDPAIYHEVAQSLNCAPEAIVFFDDNSNNVESAKAVGFNAFLTRGATEANAILDAYGLLK